LAKRAKKRPAKYIASDSDGDGHSAHAREAFSDANEETEAQFSDALMGSDSSGDLADHSDFTLGSDHESDSELSDGRWPYPPSDPDGQGDSDSFRGGSSSNEDSDSDNICEQQLLSKQAAPLLAFLASALAEQQITLISSLAHDFSRTASPVGANFLPGERHKLCHWAEDHCIQWATSGIIQRVRECVYSEDEDEDAPPRAQPEDVHLWEHVPCTSEDPVHTGSLVRLQQGVVHDLSDLVLARLEGAQEDDSPLFPGCPHTRAEVLSLLAQYKADFVVGQRAMETLLAIVGHGIVPAEPNCKFPTTLAGFDSEVSLHAWQCCLGGCHSCSEAFSTHLIMCSQLESISIVNQDL
jgi:hypothetical protein